VESIRDRLKSITEEIEDWKHLSFPVSAGEEEGKANEKEEKEEEQEEGQDIE
jgi:hypothetical protein